MVRIIYAYINVLFFYNAIIINHKEFTPFHNLLETQLWVCFSTLDFLFNFIVMPEL